MTFTPLRPDLGPAKITYDDRLPGEPLVNIAGVLEMARTGGTQECRTLEKAFNAEWRRTEGSPLNGPARQLQCLETALDEVGRKHGRRLRLTMMDD